MIYKYNLFLWIFVIVIISRKSWKIFCLVKRTSEYTLDSKDCGAPRYSKVLHSTPFSIRWCTFRKKLDLYNTSDPSDPTRFIHLFCCESFESLLFIPWQASDSCIGPFWEFDYVLYWSSIMTVYLFWLDGWMFGWWLVGLRYAIIHTSST